MTQSLSGQEILDMPVQSSYTMTTPVITRSYHSQSIYRHVIRSNGNNGELDKHVLTRFDQLKNIK